MFLPGLRARRTNGGSSGGSGSGGSSSPAAHAEEEAEHALVRKLTACAYLGTPFRLSFYSSSLFLLGRREQVGWTAFLPGTHDITTAARALEGASTGFGAAPIHPRLQGGLGSLCSLRLGPLLFFFRPFFFFLLVLFRALPSIVWVRRGVAVRQCLGLYLIGVSPFLCVAAAGDALLYDARTLHYGVANRSTRTERPLL